MIPEREEILDTTIKDPLHDGETIGSCSSRLVDGCVLARVDGEPILLTPSMTYLKLDPIGEFIVSSLMTNSTNENIVAMIVRMYEADKEEVSQDLDLFLHHLAGHGILV